LAQAAVIPVFNTGVGAGGNVLADGTPGDPHYKLITVPGGTTVLRIAAFENLFPIPPWTGTNTVSRWIGPNSDAELNSPIGDYEYQTFFDLTGLNPATASLSGLWTTDDFGLDILINGVSTGNTSMFYTSVTPFTISSGFVAGQNELIFRVHNIGGPEGLRVEISGTADVLKGDDRTVHQPEPASMLLLGTGLAAVCFLRRRFAAN
jgi:hypothetical protein